MNVDSIINGVVIDHIAAGKGMVIYNHLGLKDLDCTVALIQNVISEKMGKKDIIKIDAAIDFDMQVLGYIDPSATVNIIRDGNIIEKKTLTLPETLTNVVYCKNPRCITQTEQELDNIFKLTDAENRVYRCLYCESKAE